MRLRVGGIRQEIAEAINLQADAVGDALRDGVERAGQQVQRELRQQTRAANLGPGLSNAWRRELYPKLRNHTWRPATLVYSKATALHEAFDQGGSILPRRSKYLVITLPEGIRMGFGYGDRSRKGGAIPAGQKRKYADLDAAARQLGADVVSTAPGASRRGGSVSRGRASRPTIKLVPSAGRPGALVALYHKSPNDRPVPLFLLLRATTIPRLLNIDAVRERAGSILADEVRSSLSTLEAQNGV
ncbi:MAG: DUF6441 family protein [Pseudomonadota bacterium]